MLVYNEPITVSNLLVTHSFWGFMYLKVEFKILKSCRHGIGDRPFEEAEEFKNQSIVYVGVDSVLAGIIYVEDQIREDAQHVVESLTRQGINTYLLSGDKRGAAEYVASVVGIPKERVRTSQCLPLIGHPEIFFRNPLSEKKVTYLINLSLVS